MENEQLDEGNVYYRNAIRNADNDLNKEFGLEPDPINKFEANLYKVFNRTKVSLSRGMFADKSYKYRLNIGNNSAWLEIPQDSLKNISGEIFKGLLLKDIKAISNGGKGSYWKGSVNTLKRIYSKANGGNMINEDVIEEEIDPRIKTRIENETGYKVYLIRDNQGIEVYLKSKYCPKGQRYDIAWFQNTGNIEKQYNLRDKTIDSAKIKQVCKK